MFFLSSRLRRWVLLAVAVPLGSWALAKLADRMRAKRGETKLTRVMSAPQQWRHRRAAKAAKAA
jgi:hypothetical protein